MKQKGQVIVEFVVSMIVVASIIIYGFQALEQANRELRKERLKNTRAVKK